MEWTVVSVVIALVGLVAALAKPMLSLCKEITGLRGDLQVLSKASNDMTEKMAKFETDTQKTEYSEVLICV